MQRVQEQDIDLLILAAKARGLKLISYQTKKGLKFWREEGNDNIKWNPLVYDKDAFDLLTYLDINLSFRSTDGDNKQLWCNLWHPLVGLVELEISLGTDKKKDIRHGIVKLAAILGEKL